MAYLDVKFYENRLEITCQAFTGNDTTPDVERSESLGVQNPSGSQYVP